MATEKPTEKPKRKAIKATAFRLTPEMEAVLDQITAELGLNRTAAIEAGARILLDSARRSGPIQVKKAIEAMKSKKAP